jgi:ABC-type sugar transport system ATPase subunit
VDGLVAATADRRVIEASLEVAAGRLVAATAPAADGTTLARVVAGLAAPRSGRIYVGARDVTDLPPPRQQIGYVPAGGGLLPQLTVRGNIEYGLRRRELVRHVAWGWMATVVDRLELGHTLDLHPHRLTAAQRLRVALARAAVCLPEAVVVDLPVAVAGAGHLAELVTRATPPATAGVAVLVCSADATVLAGIPDRVRIEARVA